MKYITNYTNDNGEYDAKLQSITKLYEGTDADIQKEVVADLVGDYLFTDEKFVRNLSVNNRNVFQKVYDEIKYLCKVATAGSKEARQLEKVKKTFEDIYRESTQAEKNTTDESGVRYDISQNKITVGMSDTERANILKNKEISAPIYNNEANAQLQDNTINLENEKVAVIKSTIKRIGEQFGIFDDYNIRDIDLKVSLSKGNIDESVNKNISDTKELVKLMPVLKNAVENAVGIETHDNRYYADFDTLQFHELLGGYIDGEYFIPVRFGAKEYKNGKCSLYIIVCQEKIKTEVVKPINPNNIGKTDSRSVNISIAEIAKNVNSKDLLRYLPDYFLSEGQKTIKYEAISETIKYSNNKNDTAYKKVVEKGDIGNIERMVKEAAKANGYTIEAYHGSYSKFTKFNPNSRKHSKAPDGTIFLTSSKESAYTYTGYKNDVDLKPTNTYMGGVYSVYVKIENPLTIDFEGKQFNEKIEGKDVNEWSQYALDNGYDGLIIKNIIDDGGQGDKNWKENTQIVADDIVVFNSNQVKSADAIVYDDDGNVIPISKRFNSENNDIRYSLSKSNSHPIKRGNYNVMGEEITLDAPLGVNSNVQSDEKSNDFAPLNESVQKNKTTENIFPFLDESEYIKPTYTSIVTQDGKKVKKTFEDIYRESTQAEKNTTYESGVRYSLGQYSDKQIDNWKNSKRIIIYKNDNQLLDFVNKSLTDEFLDKKMYFGMVSTELANEIYDKTNINVENYNVSVSSYEIRKIQNDHGNEADENLRGQRAVTPDDYRHIIDTIQSPQAIKLSDNKYNNKPAIEFRSSKNDKVTVIAVVSDKHLDLFVQTAYIGKKNRNLATPTTEQADVNTSETSSGTVSTTNITNLNKNVNKNSLSQANSHPIKRGNYNIMGEEITLDAPVREDVDDKKTINAPVNKRVTFNETEINSNIKEVAKMQSVYNVSANKLEKTGKKPSEIFSDYFNKWENNIRSKVFGDISLKNSSVKSEIRHGVTAEKIASIEAIPTVIETGKVIFSETKENSDVERIVVSAPIKIGTDDYLMGVMLQRDSQNQRLYLHNVVIAKETSNTLEADLLTTGADKNNEHLFISNILQNVLNVKNSANSQSIKKEDSQLINANSPDATPENGSVVSSNDIISNQNEFVNKVRTVKTIRDELLTKIKNTKTETKYLEQKQSQSNILFDKKIVDYYNIKSINDYIGVQKSVIDKLKADEFFDNRKNVIINQNSDLIVEITKKGIKETIGSENRFEYLPRYIKELKLLTIKHLPQLIETAKVVSDNKSNYHKK